MNVSYNPTNRLEYCNYSGTIRQQPQNYRMAGMPSSSRHEWMLLPDCAADKMLVMALSLALLHSDVKGGDPKALIEIANAYLLDIRNNGINVQTEDAV